jgi:hypothetical protein
VIGNCSTRFREGLETTLVVGILVACLARGAWAEHRRSLALGVLGAVAVSLLPDAGLTVIPDRPGGAGTADARAGCRVPGAGCRVPGAGSNQRAVRHVTTRLPGPVRASAVRELRCHYRSGCRQRSWTSSRHRLTDSPGRACRDPFGPFTPCHDRQAGTGGTGGRRSRSVVTGGPRRGAHARRGTPARQPVGDRRRGQHRTSPGGHAAPQRAPGTRSSTTCPSQVIPARAREGRPWR